MTTSWLSASCLMTALLAASFHVSSTTSSTPWPVKAEHVMYLCAPTHLACQLPCPCSSVFLSVAARLLPTYLGPSDGKGGRGRRTVMTLQ